MIKRSPQALPRRRIYDSQKWRNTRRRYLADHPLCECGCNQIATDVDHIVPLERGGDPWSQSNLQALAHDCHARKTCAERAA